jgi:hypothetical protein
MLPAEYNLNLYRGDTGRWQFKLWADADKTVPVDLTGVTVEAMIRDKAPSSAYSMHLDCSITQPNIVDMVLTSIQCSDLPAKGVWDMQLTYPGGDVITPLKGTVAVTQDVTYSDVKKKLAAVQ